MLPIKKYIKRIIIEAIFKNASSSYKAKVKSLFEQWVNKLSASYIDYREQNYPKAWIVKSISYSHVEDFKQQYIKLLLKEKKRNYALIFEHEGSVYITNDKCRAFFFTFAFIYAFSIAEIAFWHKNNMLFKLSLSDFEAAINISDNYAEFIGLCEQMNEA